MCHLYFVFRVALVLIVKLDICLSILNEPYNFRLRIRIRIRMRIRIRVRVRVRVRKIIRVSD